MLDKKVAIVGGGAAGFFAAINLKEKRPEIDITIFEKSGKTLSKVRQSGGGRCNVCHSYTNDEVFLEAYPRGAVILRRLFKVFHPTDTVAWFENRGIKLKTEPDGRMFPISNSSETIAGYFEKRAKELGIKVQLQSPIHTVEVIADNKLSLNNHPNSYDAVVLCAGGNPKPEHWSIAEEHHIKTVSPVPSLFSFNVKEHVFQGLEGVSVPNAVVQIKDLPYQQQGPLLITHWGISGPSVLALSSYAARDIAQLNYNYEVKVNLIQWSEKEALNQIKTYRDENPKKHPFKTKPEPLPQRLWERICQVSGVRTQQNWAESSKNQVTNIVKNLTDAQLIAEGKTTYKEEFVTAGGIDLEELNPENLSAMFIPNLFFAGEYLNIDAKTGGYNFQAAWTTAYVVANSIARI